MPYRETGIDAERKNVEPKAEKFEFSEVGKFILEQGLRSLYKYLDRLPAEEFPEAVIFLDTSARPFVYAVKPILDVVSERHGIKKPLIRFIQPVRSSDYAEWEKRRLKKRMEENKKMGYQMTNAERSEMETAFVALDREIAERHEVEQALPFHLAERAHEILKETDAKRLLVVDECKFHGESLGKVHEAFSSLPPEEQPAIKDFIFYTQAEQPSHEWNSRNRDLIVGTTYGDLESLDDPEIGTNFVGFFFGTFPEHKEADTGVRQEETGKYVRRSPHADKERMLAIRNAMTDIAGQVLKEMVPNNYAGIPAHP